MDCDERHQPAPEPLVVSVAKDLKCGRALDLACGSGRNAIWLANRGWQVTGADISAEAIASVRSRGGIETRIADLERGEYVIEPESWELILMCRYFQRDLFEPAKRGVVPGGIVIAIALLEGRFRAKPGELVSFFEGWEILHSREEKVAEIAARRPSL